MNCIVLSGRLCADPELRQTTSNVSVCRFRVAVQRNYKDKDGNYGADFITCVAWNAQAEFISKYFSKGSAIAVRGSMQNADYTDQNGVKHYAMECKAEHIEFGSSGSKENKSESSESINLDGFEDLGSGDIPF